MRLLNSKTLTVHEFHSDDQCPPYVILSHTWGSPRQECTLQSMQEPVSPDVMARDGYQKIKRCCVQAVKDGFEWAWVDTCCIDKTSTAELSEAINSMFRWYKKAEICYAYISDVVTIADFDKSRWFTRGWTLQELVAPPIMRFYSSSWCELGTKLELKDVLSRITGIDAEVLETGSLSQVTLAKKMSWAANRKTTRAEDLAYCLLGIFDVTMPLLYGEGSKSFTRLQEEIIKSGYDYTLFAWSKGEIFDSLPQSSTDQTMTHASDSELSGLLASNPALFTYSTEVLPLETDFEDVRENIVVAGGVVIRLPIFMKQNKKFAALPCLYRGRYISFPLHYWHERFVARELGLFTAETNDLYTENGALRLQTLLLKAPTAGPLRAPVPTPIVTHIVTVNITAKELPTRDVYSSPSTRRNHVSKYWELPPNHPGLHLMCIIQPKGPDVVMRWDTAILVGGTASAKDGLWIAAVPILSGRETDSFFHKLLSVKPELVGRCTTLNHLQAELASGTDSTVFAKPGQTSETFVAGMTVLIKYDGYRQRHQSVATKRHLTFKAKLKEEYRHATERVVALVIEDGKST